MFTAPEGTVDNPVAEEIVEGGDGHDEEEMEEVIDLRACRPKPNGQSFVSGRTASFCSTQGSVSCVTVAHC